MRKRKKGRKLHREKGQREALFKQLFSALILNKKIKKRNKEIDLEKSRGISRKKEIEEKKKPVTSIVVCRELSKMHETVYRGEIKYITERIKENKDEQKGEFVVIIGK